MKLDKSSSNNTSIVIPGNAPAITEKAASELQKYIKMSIGVNLPIVTSASTPNQIIIGQGKFVEDLSSDINVQKLGDDGYTILTKGNKLIMAGGSKNGPLYAVYTFLDRYMGFKLFAPGVMKTPQLKNYTVPAINLTEVPDLILREVFYGPARDTLYGNWHKLSYTTFYQPLFKNYAHTSFQILPPSIYFKDHPEYYSLVNGKRQPFQLDYTNKDVYRLVTGWLSSMMKKTPQFKYWTVSQEDNGNYCQCDNCKRVMDSTGTPGGPLFVFVNNIAKDYWDKNISTLAYSFSRNPPRNMKLQPNLNIFYCAKVQPYAGLYTTNAYADMQSQLDGWRKLTSNIFVWDYIINYTELQSIYPNILALKPNLDFFLKKGIKGYYAEGNYYPDGEFAELRTYILARSLFIHSMSNNDIVNEFLTGFYGNAAPILNQYIQLTSKQLTGGTDLLTKDMIVNYKNLFDKAKKSVKDNPVYLARVQKEEMNIDYSAVQAYLKMAKKDPDNFFRNADNVKAFNSYADEFLSLIHKFAIKRLVYAEHNIPLHQFYSKWKTDMTTIQAKTMKTGQ
jgi:hypothetical protein